MESSGEVPVFVDEEHNMESFERKQWTGEGKAHKIMPEAKLVKMQQPFVVWGDVRGTKVIGSNMMLVMMIWPSATITLFDPCKRIC